MSWNKLKYDSCAYNKELNEQLNEFKYIMDDSKYVNCNKCRMVKGIVGGNDVSQISGNLVDLESDLRGQTRMSSLCPSHHWTSACNNMINIQPEQNQPGLKINTQLLNLPECQMFNYNPITVPQYTPNACPNPNLSPIIWQ